MPGKKEDLAAAAGLGLLTALQRPGGKEQLGGVAGLCQLRAQSLPACKAFSKLRRSLGSLKSKLGGKHAQEASAESAMHEASSCNHQASLACCEQAVKGISGNSKWVEVGGSK